MKEKSLLDSNNKKYMLQALDQLSLLVNIKKDSDIIVIHGLSGPFLLQDKDIEIFLGNFDTAMRWLAAALYFSNADRKKKIVLDSVPQMRKCPIANLIDGL